MALFVVQAYAVLLRVVTSEGRQPETGVLVANHKYRQILEKLQDDIASGRYKPGKRLPSEAELVRRFGTSRMTVFRAMSI